MGTSGPQRQSLQRPPKSARNPFHVRPESPLKDSSGLGPGRLSGITVALDCLECFGKCEPLIHRWSALQKAIATLGGETQDERTTKAHAQLLQDVLVKEFKVLLHSSQGMTSKRSMTIELLWTLFQPGALVYARQNEQETAMTLVKSYYGLDANGSPLIILTCKYVDWDGCKFGTWKLHLRKTQ